MHRTNGLIEWATEVIVHRRNRRGFPLEKGLPAPPLPSLRHDLQVHLSLLKVALLFREVGIQNIYMYSRQIVCVCMVCLVMGNRLALFPCPIKHYYIKFLMSNVPDVIPGVHLSTVEYRK